MLANRQKAFMSRMFDNSIAINLPGPPSRRKHVCEMPRKMMVTYGCTWISVGNLTKLAKRYRQMHTSFAQPDAANDLNPQELRDVYVVARPDRWSHAFTDPGSPCYWSLYCDGHYYHIEKGDKSVRITLRDDDYSEQSQKKFIPNGPQMPPFIAYHFGKTDYSPQQIHGIAVWVVDQMARDDLTKTNYGHFVSGLAVRIICAPRNSTVLMGNMMQIWAQDQLLRAAGPDSVVPNGFYTGNRLVGPTKKIDTFCARKSLRHKVEIDARQLAVCWFEGLQGFIPSDIPKTHRFIRGWKVATQSNITKTVESTLELEKRTLRRSSNINEQPRMAVIIGLRDGAKIPKDLETVHCFSSLYYIRSKRSMTEEEFLEQMKFVYGDDATVAALNAGFQNEVKRYLRKPRGQDANPSSGKNQRSTDKAREIQRWDTLCPYENNLDRCAKGYGYQILIDMALVFPSAPAPYRRVKGEQ